MAGRTIYTLTDPRDGAVRYVGVTKLSLRERLRLHQVQGRKRQDSRGRWLHELAAAGLQPVIAPLEHLADGADWAAAEQAAIERFGGTAKLLNRAKGGPSSTGAAHTAESRERHANATRRQYADASAREAQSERLRASHARPEVREKIRAAALRREAGRSPEQRAEIQAKRTAGIQAYYAARSRPPHTMSQET